MIQEQSRCLNIVAAENLNELLSISFSAGTSKRVVEGEERETEDKGKEEENGNLAT